MKELSSKPTISIVLPVYNGEKYLNEAIESCINQTFKSFELIIVDDKSTDNSLRIMQEWATKDSRIKIIKNEANKKLPASLNAGFEYARGEYYTWTSDDNILLPNFLQIMLDEIQKNKADIVYSDYMAIDENGKDIKICQMIKPENLPLSGIGSSFLYHRKVDKALHGYDTSLFLLEDYDFWVRAYLMGFKYFHIDDILYRYRWHKSSLTETLKNKIISATIKYQYKLRKKIKPNKKGSINIRIGLLANGREILSLPQMFLLILEIFIRRPDILLKLFIKKILIKNKKSNTDWHLKVPKILHIYWGGKVLPYLRFMTVCSFMKQNPDWEIMFWYPKYLSSSITWKSNELDYEVICENYLSELMKLPIKKNRVDFNDFGFKNDIAENHKSDFLRDHLLNTYGGVWSDMDILFFKPITNLKVNLPKNKERETFVCISGYGHSNGFLMAIKGSKFFEKMAIITKEEYNPEEYQCIGPTMFNKYYPTLNSINKFSPAVNMKMDTVYAYDANHIPEILENTKPKFTKGSIGLHWYAGHQLMGKFLKDTNGGLINLPNNILGNLLKNYSEINKF